MPLNKLHLPASFPAETAAALGAALHESLVATCGVHPDDDFTMVTRYAPGDMALHPSHLCTRDPAATFVVEITLLSGRTDDQKEALYRDFRQRIGRLGLKPENSIMYLVENAPVDWSFHPDGSLVRDLADDTRAGAKR